MKKCLLTVLLVIFLNPRNRKIMRHGMNISMVLFRVIIPVLVNIEIPNLDLFSFDKKVFEEKELVKMTGQNGSPDCNIKLEAILDENYSGVKTKGTSY